MKHLRIKILAIVIFFIITTCNRKGDETNTLHFKTWYGTKLTFGATIQDSIPGFSRDKSYETYMEDDLGKKDYPIRFNSRYFINNDSIDLVTELIVLNQNSNIIQSYRLSVFFNKYLDTASVVVLLNEIIDDQMIMIDKVFYLNANTMNQLTSEYPVSLFTYRRSDSCLVSEFLIDR